CAWPAEYNTSRALTSAPTTTAPAMPPPPISTDSVASWADPPYTRAVATRPGRPTRAAWSRVTPTTVPKGATASAMGRTSCTARRVGPGVVATASAGRGVARVVELMGD